MARFRIILSTKPTRRPPHVITVAHDCEAPSLRVANMIAEHIHARTGLFIHGIAELAAGAAPLVEA